MVWQEMVPVTGVGGWEVCFVAGTQGGLVRDQQAQGLQPQGSAGGGGVLRQGRDGELDDVEGAFSSPSIVGSLHRPAHLGGRSPGRVARLWPPEGLGAMVGRGPRAAEGSRPVP